MQIRINLENFDLVDTLELLKRSFADLILLTTSNLERKVFLKPCPSPPFLNLFILLLIDILVREHFSSSSFIFYLFICPLLPSSSFQDRLYRTIAFSSTLSRRILNLDSLLQKQSIDGATCLLQ